LPENDAATDTVRAFRRVAGAVWRAGTLVADVAISRAARFARRKVPVLLALRFTWSPVPPFANAVRVLDALHDDQPPAVRHHDGVHLI